VYSSEAGRMNELPRPQARKALPVISVVTFLGFLDTHLLILVMALYAFELGASMGIVGLIIGLYSITNTPANIFLGGWSGWSTARTDVKCWHNAFGFAGGAGYQEAYLSLSTNLC
jgi:MFS family permease